MADRKALILIYNSVLDCLWPRLEGNIPECPKPRCVGRITGSLLDQVEHRIDLEETYQGERRQTVEAKLTPLLTLSLILSTVLIASITAVTTLAQIEKILSPTSLIAFIFVFYVALQMCRVLWSAIDGLTRRAYKTLSVDESLPITTGEGLEEYRNRILSIRIYILEYNSWVIDQKVSDMAVAHRAYKNVIAGTLFLIVVIMIMVVVKFIAWMICG